MKPKENEKVIIHQESLTEEQMQEIKLEFRKTYAEQLESSFEKEKLHIIVSTLGNNYDVLTLSCVLFDNSWLKKFNEYNCFPIWKSLGFRKVIIRDGFQLSKEIDLRNFPDIRMELNEHESEN